MHVEIEKKLSFHKCQKLAVIALFATLIGFAARTSIGAQDQALQNGTGTFRRDVSQETKLKITAPFTIAAVGDIIEPQPVSNRAEPEFQQLLDIIRSADVSFANMESYLVDVEHFQGPLGGTLAPKEVGADIKAMGFKIMNHANNHAWDGTQLGMFSTDEILDQLGIVHAGTGKNLNEARAPKFLDNSWTHLKDASAWSVCFQSTMLAVLASTTLAL